MNFGSQLDAALALIGKGRTEKALQVFEKIKLQDLAPFEQCIVLLNKKKCLELLGRLDEAQAQLQIQQIDTSNQFDVLLESGHIDLLFARGEFSEYVERARALLQKGHQQLHQPGYENVLYGLCLNAPLALISLGRFEEGLSALRSFLPHIRKEDESRAHMFLAIGYLHLGQNDAAITEFEWVLKFDFDPTVVAEAHYRLGALRLDEGSPVVAKRHFKAAEELKEALSGIPLRDLYMFLANTCAQLGERYESNRYLQLANSI